MALLMGSAKKRNGIGSYCDVEGAGQRTELRFGELIERLPVQQRMAHHGTMSPAGGHGPSAFFDP